MIYRKKSPSASPTVQLHCHTTEERSLHFPEAMQAVTSSKIESRIRWITTTYYVYFCYDYRRIEYCENAVSVRYMQTLHRNLGSTNPCTSYICTVTELRKSAIPSLPNAVQSSTKNCPFIFSGAIGSTKEVDLYSNSDVAKIQVFPSLSQMTIRARGRHFLLILE